MKNSIMELMFLDLYQTIKGCLFVEFPHLRDKSFKNRLERKVSKLAFDLLAHDEVLVFEEKWDRYNKQKAQLFLRNMVIYNSVMTETPIDEVDPFVIFNISL